MTLPPSLLRIGFPTEAGRHWHLWLPLFILWPFTFVLGAIALIVTVIADIALKLSGARFYKYSRLLIGCVNASCAVRGLHVCIKSDKTTVDLSLI